MNDEILPTMKVKSPSQQSTEWPQQQQQYIQKVQHHNTTQSPKTKQNKPFYFKLPHFSFQPSFSFSFFLIWIIISFYGSLILELHRS